MSESPGTPHHKQGWGLAIQQTSGSEPRVGAGLSKGLAPKCKDPIHGHICKRMSFDSTLENGTVKATLTSVDYARDKELGCSPYETPRKQHVLCLVYLQHFGVLAWHQFISSPPRLASRTPNVARTATASFSRSEVKASASEKPRRPGQQRWLCLKIGHPPQHMVAIWHGHNSEKKAPSKETHMVFCDLPGAASRRMCCVLQARTANSARGPHLETKVQLIQVRFTRLTYGLPPNSRVQLFGTPRKLRHAH